MNVRETSQEDILSGRHVCVVVLNWNGWQDTIECLESLLHLDYQSRTVIVCDNASTDGSFEKIRRWASGELISCCVSSQLANLTTPPVAKPVPMVSYTTPHSSLGDPGPSCSLVLIQTGSNLGFAGGCNVGLRYALARTSCGFVWLLNNDTVVDRDSLTKLVEKMSAEPRLGICGSLLLDYASPHKVQALGGRRYSPWSGRVLPQNNAIRSESGVLMQPINYVHGASMLVRREFLQDVGLMAEEYFLYFEELDWAMRAGDRFRFGYAPLSLVYHKEGASIGTNALRRKRSLLSEWYAARNRLLFTRKFHPLFVPTVLGWVAFTALHRLLTGNPQKAWNIASAAWDGLTCSKFPT